MLSWETGAEFTDLLIAVFLRVFLRAAPLPPHHTPSVRREMIREHSFIVTCNTSTYIVVSSQLPTLATVIGNPVVMSGNTVQNARVPYVW